MRSYAIEYNVSRRYTAFKVWTAILQTVLFFTNDGSLK